VGSLRRGEHKSLALHRSLAARLREDPSLRTVVRQRLDWLRAKNPAGTPYYDEWARLIEGPLETLLGVMGSPSVHACALRQESPFVDLVDQAERARIYREVADTLDRALS
jgi:hypothetical protein